MNSASRLRSNLALLLTSGLSELAARFARCHFIMIHSQQNLGVRRYTEDAPRKTKRSHTRVAALAEFYDDETIVFPPRGATLGGRQSMRSYWTRQSERRILEHSAVAERVDATHELATEYGKLRITSQVGGGPATRDSATYISYWRRGRDGVWRKQLDTWW
jgi:ketosteroid isomerase-like protein